MSKSGEFYD